MTPPILIELGYRGIFPGAAYHRQPCPECSPRREKHDEACLVAKLISDTEADVICYHCNPVWERVKA